VSGKDSRLQAVSQAIMARSLVQYSLAIPLIERLPSWVLIVCGVLALLRATIPQKSAHRLAWWASVLRRDSLPPGSGTDSKTSDN
jgi:hypothetical protein